MNFDFENRDLLELFTGERGRYARSLPPVVITRFFELMDDIAAASDQRELRTLKGARLEKVPSECKECFSMRLNSQFRLILKFQQIDGQPGASIVDVRDYH